MFPFLSFFPVSKVLRTLSFWAKRAGLPPRFSKPSPVSTALLFFKQRVTKPPPCSFRVPGNLSFKTWPSDFFSFQTLPPLWLLSFVARRFCPRPPEELFFFSQNSLPHTPEFFYSTVFLRPPPWQFFSRGSSPVRNFFFYFCHLPFYSFRPNNPTFPPRPPHP